MKNNYKHILTLAAFSIISIVGCSGESSSSAVLDGLYEQPIGELEQSEPVATYLAIRDHLADGNLEEASQLTDNPAKFFEKRKELFDRMGEETFKTGNGRTREVISVHSVHHDGDQSLIVIDTGKYKAATFFIRKDSKFFEVVDTSGFSKKLTRAFYVAKGEPDVELAGD